MFKNCEKKKIFYEQLIAKIVTEFKMSITNNFLQLLVTRVFKSCFLTAFIKALMRS